MKEAYIPAQKATDLANQAMRTNHSRLYQVNPGQFIEMSRLLAATEVGSEGLTERGPAFIDVMLNTGIGFADQTVGELERRTDAIDTRIGQIREELVNEPRQLLIFEQYLSARKRTVGTSFARNRGKEGFDFELDDHNRVVLPAHLREREEYAHLHKHQVHRTTAKRIRYEKEQKEVQKKISEAQTEQQMEAVYPFVVNTGASKSLELEGEIETNGKPNPNHFHENDYVEDGPECLPRTWDPGRGLGVQHSGVHADKRLLDQIVIEAFQPINLIRNGEPHIHGQLPLPLGSVSKQDPKLTGHSKSSDTLLADETPKKRFRRLLLGKRKVEDPPGTTVLSGETPNTAGSQIAQSENESPEKPEKYSKIEEHFAQMAELRKEQIEKGVSEWKQMKKESLTAKTGFLQKMRLVGQRVKLAWHDMQEPVVWGTLISTSLYVTIKVLSPILIDVGNAVPGAYAAFDRYMMLFFR